MLTWLTFKLTGCLLDFRHFTQHFQVCTNFRPVQQKGGRDGRWQVVGWEMETTTINTLFRVAMSPRSISYKSKQAYAEGLTDVSLALGSISAPCLLLGAFTGSAKFAVEKQTNQLWLVMAVHGQYMSILLAGAIKWNRPSATIWLVFQIHTYIRMYESMH